MIRQNSRIHILTATVALMALGGCTSMTDIPTDRIGSGTLKLGSGLPAGTVQLVASGDQVSLAIAATGLSAGPRGFHLHTKGECTAPDFMSAGGHLNPLGRAHGKEADGGAHYGDLPNLVFSAQQTAAITVPLPGTRAEAERYLFDADGTAVIIHAQADDYRTDPTGNAGPRAACAVLKRD